MGNIRCFCGNVISTTCFPDSFTGHLFTSYAIDQERLDDDMEVIECKQCGRLLIEDRENPTSTISFKPEDGKYHKLLLDSFK